MFSRRTPGVLSPNIFSDLLAQQERSSLLDLTATNPTTVGLSLPGDVIRKALSQPEVLTYSPEPFGTLLAREEIARYYLEVHQQEVRPEHIVLTASTSEAYTFLFKLLCNPGEAVLSPRPSYPLFEHLMGLEGVVHTTYPLGWDGSWYLDVDLLGSHLTPQCRAVVVVAPNNPTGTYLKRPEWDSLQNFCATNDLALIADEVFVDFPLSMDPNRVTGLWNSSSCLSFSLNGLSKILGLPQLKLGWMVVGGPPALRDEALNRLEIIADSFLSVSAPVQVALGTLLAQRDHIQGNIRRRLLTNLRTLKELLPPSSPMSILEVEGGWSVILRIPRVQSDEQVCLLLLKEEGIVVHPGYFFDLPEGHLVLSLLTPEATFAAGLPRLVRCLARLW